MPATVWPAFVSALVSTWQSAVASGSSDMIYDGPPTAADAPMRWVTVGYADGLGPGVAFGHIEWAQADDGWVWQEKGQVMCEIVAQTGDPDLPSARADAFAFLDVLTAALRADRTLGGVLSKDSTVDLMAEPMPEADAESAVQRIHVTVTYTTTT